MEEREKTNVLLPQEQIKHYFDTSCIKLDQTLELVDQLSQKPYSINMGEREANEHGSYNWNNGVFIIKTPEGELYLTHGNNPNTNKLIKLLEREGYTKEGMSVPMSAGFERFTNGNFNQNWLEIRRPRTNQELADTIR